MRYSEPTVVAFALAVTVAGLCAGVALAQQCSGGLCTGGAGDDVLRGTPEFDAIEGNGGEDRIYGYANFDQLRGGLAAACC